MLWNESLARNADNLNRSSNIEHKIKKITIKGTI